MRKLLLKRIKGALYVGCVMIRRMSNFQVLRLILEFSLLPRLSRGLVIDVPSLQLPFFEESSRDDSNVLTFSSDESSKDVQLSHEELSI